MATMVRSEPFSTPAHQAYQLLHVALTIIPLIAGIDKFVGLLANWEMYLAPVVARLAPVPAHTFMEIDGAIEVIAGLIVAFVPRVGGWIVATWLWLIILNLLLVPGFYDIALRDFGLSLAAVALARLATEYHRRVHG